MATLTNEKGEIALGTFRHFSPLPPLPTSLFELQERARVDFETSVRRAHIKLYLVL